MDMSTKQDALNQWCWQQEAWPELKTGGGKQSCKTAFSITNHSLKQKASKDS